MSTADWIAVGGFALTFILTLYAQDKASKAQAIAGSKADADAVHDNERRLIAVEKDVEWILKFVPPREDK